MGGYSSKDLIEFNKTSKQHCLKNCFKPDSCNLRFAMSGSEKNEHLKIQERKYRSYRLFDDHEQATKEAINAVCKTKFQDLSKGK